MACNVLTFRVLIEAKRVSIKGVLIELTLSELMSATVVKLVLALRLLNWAAGPIMELTRRELI